MNFAQRAVTAVIVTLHLPQASAQGEARELTPPTEALVFKSGQSCLSRRVTVEPNETTTRLRLPEALHGTVWLGSDNVELKNATAHRATTKTMRPVEDIAGALVRARGREVRLTVMHGQEDTPSFLSGTLQHVIYRRTEANAYRVAGTIPTFKRTPALAVLRNGPSEHVVKVSSITALFCADPALAEADWKFEQETEVSVLDVDHGLATAGTDASIQLDAMSDGLAWTPSYVLELGDGKQARLVGKAVLVNDAEPLVNTRIRLVVGFPNLQFAGIASSLRPEVTLDTFRQMLGSNAPGRGQGDVMSQMLGNVLTTNTRSSRGGAAGPAQPMPGESAEDLYIYDIGKVTLAKGGRLYAPLLSADVKFEHRYDWDIADRVDRSSRFITSSEEQAQPVVWHVLTLKNATTAPWTTAPILIQGANGPLAQSTLTYTPTGSETTVKLTKALDLVGDAVEVRTDKDAANRGEVRMFGRRYETVEVEGRVELANRSEKSTPVRIRKTLSGDLLAAEGEPAVRGNAEEIGLVNASRTLTWTFDLAPGETWKATYRYRVLIWR